MSIDKTKDKYRVVATGEPDEDYDHPLFDEVVEGFKKIGYQAWHKEFDKYQGVFIQVSKGGKVIERFWVEDVMDYKDGDINIFVLPELNSKIEVPADAPLVMALRRQGKDRYKFVDMTNVESWLKTVMESNVVDLEQKKKMSFQPKKGDKDKGKPKTDKDEEVTV